MSELITYATYEDYRAEVGKELNKSAESFVRIGYLLKMARDTNILEGRYDSVNEFAQTEFGLDKTMVSRFIHINDRFSVGGNSENLLHQYQGFGYAKLTLMLQLPDGLNEALTPEYSKAEIQALKEEMDEEKKVSDIEMYLEAPKQVNSTLCEICKEILKDRELFKVLWSDTDLKEKELLEILAPAGQAIYMTRIPGMGRLSVVLNADKEYAVITSMRSGETRQESIGDMLNEIKTLIGPGKNLEESYQEIYGEAYVIAQFEKKDEVAPVQPPKQAPRKESKVKKAAVPQKKKPEPEPKQVAEPEVEKVEGIVEEKTEEKISYRQEAIDAYLAAKRIISTLEENEANVPFSNRIMSEKNMDQLIQESRILTNHLMRAKRYTTIE